MIHELIAKKRVIFRESFSDWRSAVRESCTPLLADGSIGPEYVDSIIACIEEHGPYIVIAPDICIPHSLAGGPGVNESAISFMHVVQPVSFEPGNPEKDARLFFVLAAKDPTQHLANLVKLVEMLDDETQVKKLIDARSIDDLNKAFV